MVAVGLAVAGCGSEGADRSEASETAAAEQSAASSSADGVASGTPTPLATPLPTAAATSPDTDGEPSRDQDGLNGDSPLASPSVTPKVDKNSGDDGTGEGVGEEDATPLPPSLEDNDRSEEDVGEGVESSVDKVEVDSSSITVRDCVARGLVHNNSDKLFARNVVITLLSPDGDESVEWHWPLTMQPGEEAPFELEISWPSEDIIVEVAADMSEEPDLSRSFLVNVDGTPRDWGNNKWEPYINVYDERYYALEGTDVYGIEYLHPYQNTFTHIATFRQQFPASLVKSNDIDTVVLEYDGIEFSDVYFKPEVIFPELTVPGDVVSVDNLRVYQAILESSRVIDVRELIPYTIEMEQDVDGSLVERVIAPVGQVSNLMSGEGGHFYILHTLPLDSFDRRFVDDERHQQLWMGDANGDGPFDGEAEGPGALNEGGWRGLPPAPCDPPAGGLTWRRVVATKGGDHESDKPMGYYGVFSHFDPSQDFVGKLVVDRETVTVADGVIRGEILYLLEELDTPLLAAGSVFVHASSENDSAAWVRVWPLYDLLYPGRSERFEIHGWTGSNHVDEIAFKVFGTFWISSWEEKEETDGSLYRDYPSQYMNHKVIVERDTVILVDGVIRGLVINQSDQLFARDVVVTASTGSGSNTATGWQWPLTVQPGERAPFEIAEWGGSANIEDIEFTVSSTLSERVDVSRSFQIIRNRVGIVYREGMEDTYRQERYNRPRIPTADPGNVLYHYEDEFLSLYPYFLTSDGKFGTQGLFYFDFNAELEETDSHPNLNDEIRSQVVEDLRAYVAFFNSDMDVVAIEEIEPLTAIYQPPEYEPKLIPVSTVPTPSAHARHSVRLLVTIPREDAQQSSQYQFFQIWIGGALEPRS
ncbi:hypothetical protein [Candidatus Poriferisocius sp.]|uniref:hypothetical protein n=1 Tax=Candidatus Poriferisocius sp. TaxID=3101276 RepID=UPI003B02C9E9